MTYQHRGFFTPLFHISVAVGNPSAMMTSVSQATAGHRFWFTPGAALVGLVVHMMTGAAFGMMFAVFARATRDRMLLLAGALFGLMVFVVSSFIGLPIAAAITNSGSVLSDMAKMVGWTTFAVEHLIFGLAVGAVLLVASPSTDRLVRTPVTGRTTATV